jgi:hypothetical protein
MKKWSLLIALAAVTIGSVYAAIPAKAKTKAVADTIVKKKKMKVKTPTMKKKVKVKKDTVKTGM